ncbi:hypothetical protein MA16_Dca008961 [Dendrobium catenatum]|uniref:Uncharacterized protein n=1 Tax=Dendrobium catenatum TaxID=906689 RepID=A0A2I0WRQ1_9ASPA|nr:hypothetical protein MA16_Dca008961 [Dendrobium catenatum]
MQTPNSTNSLCGYKIVTGQPSDRLGEDFSDINKDFTERVILEWFIDEEKIGKVKLNSNQRVKGGERATDSIDEASERKMATVAASKAPVVTSDPIETTWSNYPDFQSNRKSVFELS